MIPKRRLTTRSHLHGFTPSPLHPPRNHLVVVRSLSSLAATVLVDLSKSFSFSPRSFGPNKRSVCTPRTQITLVFHWSLGLVKTGEKAQLAFKNRPVSWGFRQARKMVPPRMLAGCWQVKGLYLGIPQTSKCSKSPGGDEKIPSWDAKIAFPRCDHACVAIRNACIIVDIQAHGIIGNE